MNRDGRFLAASIAMFLLAPPCQAAEPAVTVQAGHASGDHGTGESRDYQSVTVRVATGGRFRLIAELPLVRARSPLGVAHTSLGPAPLSRDQQDLRPGAGGQGSGNGQGGGGRGDPGSGDLPAANGDDGWISGPGDLRLGLEARLIGKPAGLYRLDAELELKAPTAEEEDGLGTGEWDMRLGLSGERRFWSLTAFAGAGWNRLGDPVWIDLEDAADAFFGIETEPRTGDLLWSLWMQGNTETVPGAGARALLGAGLRRERRRPWTLGAFVGITDASEDFGIAFGMAVGKGGRRSGGRELVR